MSSHFLKIFLFVLMLIFSHSSLHALTQNEHSAIFNIVTQFILDDKENILNTPRLTEDINQTRDDNISVEINGEIGATVWVNGVEKGTIGEDGKLTLVLDTSGVNGTKTFSIVLNNANGNVSEVLIVNVERVPNIVPIIMGIAKTTIHIYATYQFVPTVSDGDADMLSFSIQNKPSWAEFNSTTGELKGVPSFGEEGNTSTIIISVSDGREIVSLAPFSIEVQSALNLAYLYGEATQPPKNGYYYYSEPSKAIDGNISTNNHTQCSAPDNWLQIELPAETKVHKIVLHNVIGQEARLNGSTVYLSNNNYTGLEVVNSADSLVTLNADRIQTIEPSVIEGSQYLLIKGNPTGSNSCLHLREVEVYGVPPSAPDFQDKNDFNLTIDKWQNKIESIFDINARDYQYDTIMYSLDGNVPFVISAEGKIRVSNLLTVGEYTFDILISDGVNITRKPITITVIADPIIEIPFRTNDNQPALSGFLPNIYNDNDIVTVEINGVTYTAIVNNGMWSIEDDMITPSLQVGLHDINLIINGTEILYSNYFEVYAERMQSVKQSLLLETIANVPVNVINAITTPLVKDERVRGNSIRLYVENGVTKLENKSYRTIASLLGKYENASGDSIFVKLNFSESIKPYSDNNLSTFAHDINMSIVITANHFNGEFSFGGEDCTEATRDITIYCTPTTINDMIYSDTAVQNDTLSEQQLYSITLATYNHYFNSIDGLQMMRAWVEKSSYKSMDFTGDYQSIDNYIGNEDKMSYLYRHFYNFTMPEHHINLRMMRYRYAAQGMASVTSVIPLDGSNSSSGWASLWEGALDLSETSDYEYILHEIGHAYSNGHNTGMSYGWPHAFQQVVDTLYVVKEYPLVNVPKYIFETKVLSSTQTKIIVHQTTDANEDEMTFELLSSTPLIANDLSISADVNENSVILSNNKGIVTRLFLRVYGDDSLEIASEMLLLN